MNFLPIYDGSVSASQPSLNFRGDCFAYDITYTALDDRHFELKINSRDQRWSGCKDYLFIANTEIRRLVDFKYQTEKTV